MRILLAVGFGVLFIVLVALLLSIFLQHLSKVKKTQSEEISNTPLANIHKDIVKREKEKREETYGGIVNSYLDTTVLPEEEKD